MEASSHNDCLTDSKYGHGKNNVLRPGWDQAIICLACHFKQIPCRDIDTLLSFGSNDIFKKYTRDVLRGPWEPYVTWLVKEYPQ